MDEKWKEFVQNVLNAMENDIKFGDKDVMLSEKYANECAEPNSVEWEERRKKALNFIIRFSKALEDLIKLLDG